MLNSRHKVLVIILPVFSEFKETENSASYFSTHPMQLHIKPVTFNV